MPMAQNGKVAITLQNPSTEKRTQRLRKDDLELQHLILTQHANAKEFHLLPGLHKPSFKPTPAQN